MEFKVIFSMDKKTIECIDRLAGALVGINNIALPVQGEEIKPITEVPHQEPLSSGTPVSETPQETVPESGTPQAEPEPTSQPETAQRTYTRDELSKAAAEFARSGAEKREKLQGLVKEKYGVNGLMDIPADRYGEFAADLREMGANV